MKKSLFIATPHNGAIPATYLGSMMWAWHDLMNKYDLAISTMESALIHKNRNHLFREAYKNNADYLLFIDTDVVWNTEDIEKLIALDKPIVSGVYKSRRPLQGIDHAYVVFGRRDDGTLGVYEKLPDVPFIAFSVGMGFCLIKKEVITMMMKTIPSLGYPFDYIDIKDISDDTCDISDLAGEDVSFCHRARKAGFDVWVHPDVLVGHITPSVII